MKERTTIPILLLLLSLMAGCKSPDKHWRFSTEYFSIEVDSKGYITSMKNITAEPAMEFSPEDKPSPLMTLYDSGAKEYIYPTKAGYDRFKKKMVLHYPNGSEAGISIKEKGKYIRMELTGLKGRGSIDAVQWGHYHTGITNLLGEIIGVARDTSEAVNYSIGVLSLDDNTLGGTADTEGDAAPAQYIIHTPDKERFPLPDSLHEGQTFSLGGDGISDVAFYAHKEPWYRIMYGNAAMVDDKGRISLSYQSRDRRHSRQILYSLIPHMEANTPNHIDVEAVPGVDFIGSSVAFWGSPDSTALVDVIRNVVISEKLPYPTVDGLWVKDPAAYMPDLMTYGNKYDSVASYASQMGLKAIHAYDQGFLRPDRSNGGFLDDKNGKVRRPFRFASDAKTHKEFSDMLAGEGLMLGRVCITNSLAPGTKDASPEPSDSLCYQQKRLLLNDISPDDTTIVIDDALYMDEIASWEGHCPNLNIVKIGKELIHYLGVTDTTPYRLKNVTRGYWGTEKAEHHGLDTLYKLQVTINYGYDGLIPNLELQDKIAGYYAEVAANSGVTLYDFDGQEFLFNNGHGYYSVKRFFRKMFQRAEELGVPYIRFSGATLSEGSYHYQSVWNVGGGRNLYDLDTREWGSTTSQGKDLRDVTYSNFFPVSFGGNFAIVDTSTVVQYEHIEAISAGYGATCFLRICQDDVESCPQKYQIFKAVRTWEEARRANAFPRFVRKKLMRPEYDWTLEPGTDGNSWTLYRLEMGEKVEEFRLHRAKGYR